MDDKVAEQLHREMYQMKKTLFVHIKDKSTDFLERIWKGRKNCTVVRTTLSPSVMNILIESHDQVVMLGHGCPTGLFGDDGRLIISKANVSALKRKDNSVFIWCYASAFAFEHGLRGFSTGMFVSEVGEARYCIDSTFDNAAEVWKSNDLFARLVREHIGKPIAETAKLVRAKYCIQEDVDIDDQLVMAYNSKLLTLLN